MRTIKEYLKYLFILVGALVRPKNNNVLVSMLSKSDTNGPGRFIKNLSDGLTNTSDIKIIRNPFKGFHAILIISNMPPLIFKIFNKLGVKTILRVDGFSYPDLYDNLNDVESIRRRHPRDFSLYRMRTNFQIQTSLKLADYIIYQSQFSRQVSNKWLCNRENNYSIIYNGVNTQLFQPIEAINKKKCIVSVHGNLRDPDIIICCLEVFGKLSSILGNQQLILRIIGSLTEDVAEIVFKEKEKKVINLEVTGSVSPKTLSTILPESTLSLHLTSSDACPNSVLESLASGVPVVCQHFGGQSELVGNAGIVINTGVEYDYSEQMVELAVEACKDIMNDVTGYSLKARQRAEINFSIEKMSQQYSSILCRETIA
ncbi:glycosyltransferase family 4 protein [Glaciecola petra]|uniref:Glycosyltransferase family 4 protein n=1 Tax=Glaciecola petra TaxID=3075602 RepID=A0ABU2ZM14_9ALTE|nr:glycosyltransferase family 4 protein [Aestuariibacter sp. P117]MDT0593665.1 glycosyltransferase family 4 protein [Aestuariibacter sp. P117]